MNGILEIEDDGVGPVQRGVDKVFGLGAGKVQPRTTQAVSRRWLRKHDLFRRSFASDAESGASCRSLDPRCNHERQSTLISQFDARMLDAQNIEHLPRLRQYGLAIVGRDPGLHGDLDAAAVARLDGHVQIGTHVTATVSGLA